VTAAREAVGFSWTATAAGELRVLHHGRPAATLRGRAARELQARLKDLDEQARQQLLARVTGQYRRGNEGEAARHPRNRR
jgi:hypothetical protein